MCRFNSDKTLFKNCPYYVTAILLFFKRFFWAMQAYTLKNVVACAVQFCRIVIGKPFQSLQLKSKPCAVQKL